MNTTRCNNNTNNSNSSSYSSNSNKNIANFNSEDIVYLKLRTKIYTGKMTLKGLEEILTKPEYSKLLNKQGDSGSTLLHMVLLQIL